jgi:hypothetical protein
MHLVSTNFQDRNMREAVLETYTDFADITITDHEWGSEAPTSTIDLRIRLTPGDLLFLDALREAIDKAIKWARAN